VSLEVFVSAREIYPSKRHQPQACVFLEGKTGCNVTHHTAVKAVATGLTYGSSLPSLQRDVPAWYQLRKLLLGKRCQHWRLLYGEVQLSLCLIKHNTIKTYRKLSICCCLITRMQGETSLSYQTTGDCEHTCQMICLPDS
jgi:hypothetical protein